MTITNTLQERQRTHGSFPDNAFIMQALKRVCYAAPNHYALAAYKKEAIDMICHKLGRILTGDSNFIDHWHDIAGYATLVEEILKDQKVSTPGDSTNQFS